MTTDTQQRRLREFYVQKTYRADNPQDTSTVYAMTLAADFLSQLPTDCRRAVLQLWCPHCAYDADYCQCVFRSKT